MSRRVNSGSFSKWRKGYTSKRLRNYHTQARSLTRTIWCPGSVSLHVTWWNVRFISGVKISDPLPSIDVCCHMRACVAMCSPVTLDAKPLVISDLYCHVVSCDATPCQVRSWFPYHWRMLSWSGYNTYFCCCLHNSLFALLLPESLICHPEFKASLGNTKFSKHISPRSLFFEADPRHEMRSSVTGEDKQRRKKNYHEIEQELIVHSSDCI